MFHGSCHCKNIEFTVDAPITEVMECNCSICSRKGFLLAFVSQDQISINAPEKPLTKYLFNKDKIMHEFCPVCGVQCFASVNNEDGTKSFAVNVRTVQDIDIPALPVTQVDGKSL
ncbi:MAG: GFA family protein [Candidatus Gracilibacteria bacterium]